MAKLLTQYAYYREQQEKDPKALLLMRDYEAYYILGEKAKKALPIVKKMLTDKNAGECYCYDPENYGYIRLSFGKHNLHVMVPAFIDAGFKVVLTDFNIAFREARGWEEVGRIIKEHKDYEERLRREAEERERRKPVQLSLFDAWEM